MKKLCWITIILLRMLPLHAQNTYDIRADSVYLHNSGQSAEFRLQNHTMDSIGFLFNNGNGRTGFRRLQLERIGSNQLGIAGLDTIQVEGRAVLDTIYRTGDTLMFRVGSRLDKAFLPAGTRFMSGEQLAGSNGNRYIGNVTRESWSPQPSDLNYMVHVSKTIKSGTSESHGYFVSNGSFPRDVFSVYRSGVRKWYISYLTNTQVNQHMVIDGNFGMNTTNPQYMLDIAGTDTVVAYLEGYVSGQPAVDPNEFVTKGQLLESRPAGYKKIRRITDSDYTITAEDYTLVLSSTSVQRNLTLPSAAGMRGRILVLLPAGSASAGWIFNVSVYEDESTSVTSTVNTAYTIQSDGTRWVVISGI